MTWQGVLEPITLSAYAKVVNEMPDDLAKSICLGWLAPVLRDLVKDPALSADKAQAILYGVVEGRQYRKILQIITEEQADETITADTTLTGIILRRNVSISAGVTLTLDGQPAVLIADSVVNDGIITKTPTGGAGGTTPSAPGAGGNGGGGLIIIARYFKGGVVRANGVAGEGGATVAAGWGHGGAGGYGEALRLETDTLGAGGKGGDGGRAGEGKVGGGGGGIADPGALGSGGSGGDITYTDFADAYELTERIFKPAVDFYLDSIGKTPTTPLAFPNVRGAGGGGGAENDYYGDCGGGGGSAGVVYAVALDIEGGTFEANGGNGGDGGTEGGNDGPGGGGGGGLIYVLTEREITAPTFAVSGGLAGTGDYAAVDGGAGVSRVILL